jgi:hypothetical protein
MFDVALDAIAQATGCDRSALGELVGPVPEPTNLSPERLLERIAAEERLVSALRASQARDVAAFVAVKLAEDGRHRPDYPPELGERHLAD